MLWLLYLWLLYPTLNYVWPQLEWRRMKSHRSHRVFTWMPCFYHSRLGTWMQHKTPVDAASNSHADLRASRLQLSWTLGYVGQYETLQKCDGKSARDFVVVVVSRCKSRQMIVSRERRAQEGEPASHGLHISLDLCPPFTEGLWYHPLIPDFLEWTESHKYRRPEQQVRMHKLWPRPPSPPSSPPPSFLTPPADTHRLAPRSSSSSSFPLSSSYQPVTQPCCHVVVIQRGRISSQLGAAVCFFSRRALRARVFFFSWVRIRAWRCLPCALCVWIRDL